MTFRRCLVRRRMFTFSPPAATDAYARSDAPISLLRGPCYGATMKKARLLPRRPVIGCRVTPLAFLPAVWRKAVVVAVAVAISAVSAAAQRISGRVVDGANNLPLADLPIFAATADGEVAGAARTSADGTFTLALKHPGAYKLRVLRMGYWPTEYSFDVRDTVTLRVQVELGTRRITDVTLLTTVVIRGRQVQVPSRFADVLERARTGFGVLLTRADFETTGNVKLALGTIPTVFVNQRGVYFAKCDTRKERFAPGTAKVQVYINGMRLSLPGDDNVENVLKLVAPADIELMEVYTGVARLPAEYVNDACAVIAIWTK